MKANIGDIKYDIKFKGTEEQIAKIVKILVGQGVEYSPGGYQSSLFVYDIGERQSYKVMQHLGKFSYEGHEFKAVDPVGFIEAHSDISGNPWMANTGVAPDVAEAGIQVVVDWELDYHDYDSVCAAYTTDDFIWNDEYIVKWRFANMEDAEKWYARKDDDEIKSLANYHKGEVIVPTGPIKSDGGSSDYYKLKLTLKDGAVVECETGDVIRAMVGNDFDLGNVIKAVRRIYQASLGQGKEGIDVQYDKKKIHYFLDEFIDHMKI